MKMHSPIPLTRFDWVCVTVLNEDYIDYGIVYEVRGDSITVDTRQRGMHIFNREYLSVIGVDVSFVSVLLSKIALYEQETIPTLRARIAYYESTGSNDT